MEGIGRHDADPGAAAAGSHAHDRGGSALSRTSSPDRVAVGKDLGGHEYEIGRERVALYEAGTADHNPLYGEVAPALLFHSECYTFLQDWYLPNLVGNLHAKQEWELFGAARVGERVRSRAFVAERYRKRTRDYVVCETLLFGESGAVLVRGRTHQSFLTEAPEGVVVDKEREKSADRRFVVGQGSGREMAIKPRRITLEMCRAFSGPSENYHTNREMARALGFPDIVVQGMMTLCFLSGLLTREFGRGWLQGGKMAVSLVNVAWCDDVVTARAKVREEAEEGSKTRVQLDVWCEKTDSTKVVVGTASALA
jgi:acyl dehydratase